MNNLETIRKVYEVFGKGDMPALFGLMAPDIEWRPAEGHPLSLDGRPWKGTQDLLQGFFQKVGVEWNSFGCSPRLFHEAGDRIIVEGRYWGEHKTTGKKLDSAFCHVWILQDGRVKIFQQYTDTAALQEVMGPVRSQGG